MSKRKEWKRRYERSAKGKAAIQRYQRSAKGKAKFWRAHLKHMYGLTEQEYAALLKAADGRCAICKRIAETLCVDHNHDTKAVRGMLCRQCNNGLGHFYDDIEVLRSAVKYLTEDLLRGL